MSAVVTSYLGMVVVFLLVGILHSRYEHISLTVVAAGGIQESRASPKKKPSFVVKKRIGAWVESKDGLLRAVS